MENNLFLGVSREDITPEIGTCLYGYFPDFHSESIADNLTLTAFVFKSGNTKAVMISACVCIIHDSLADELCSEIAALINTNRNNIIISATHTHTGPALADSDGWGGIDFKYYNRIFKPAVLKAVKEADKKIEPVTMAVGYGKSKVGVNRREICADNTIAFGQNKWGVYNPEMTVISFKNDEGKIISTMIHYGCHGTAAGHCTAISRDWSGIMTDAVDAVYGGITAFFNGTEGDVGPRISNGLTIGDMTYVRELGAVASSDSLKVYENISKYENAGISVKSAIVKIPLLPRISYEEAEKGYSKFEGDICNIAMFEREYYKKVMSSYDVGYEEKEYFEVNQTIIKIGNIVFVSFPFELFSEIGMRIDYAFTDLKILPLSNSNGMQLYFPTEDQLCRGGYEIDCFKFARVQRFVDDADYHLVKETIKNIAE